MFNSKSIKTKLLTAEDNIKKNHAIYLGILFAVISLFACIKDIVIPTHDDLVGYLIVLEEQCFEHAVFFAKQQGRIWFIPNMFLEFLPMSFGSWVVYKAFSYAGLLFSSICLYILIRRHVNKDCALLSFLLFFALAQLDNQHNALIAYVFWRQIDIGFIFIAIERYLEFYRSRKKSAMVVSAATYFIASVLYESNILFLAIFGLIALYKNFDIKNRKLAFKKMVSELLVPIIAAAIYLIIYFVWRTIYPSIYVGNIVDNNFNLGESIITCLVLSFGKFPLFTAFITFISSGVRSLNDILNYIDPIMIISAVLISISVVLILKRSKSTFTLSFMIKSTVLAVISIIIPTALHSLTSQYKNWVVNCYVTSYVPSIICFFMIAGIIALWIVYLYQIIPFKRIFMTVAFSFIFIASLLTSVSNEINKEGILAIQRYYELFAEFIASDYYRDMLNDDCQVYIPQLTRVPLDESDLYGYSYATTGKQTIFIKDLAGADLNKPICEVYFDENSHGIMAGFVNDKLETDSMCIIKDTDTINKSISIITGLTENNNSYVLESAGNTHNYNTNHIMLNLNDLYHEQYINCSKIKIEMCNLLEEPICDNFLADLTMDENFYGMESDGNNVWYWSKAQSNMVIINQSGDEEIVNLKMSCSSATAEGGELIITYNGQSESYIITPQAAEITFTFTAASGANIISLSYNGDRIDPATDPRDLYFAVHNPSVNISE